MTMRMLRLFDVLVDEYKQPSVIENSFEIFIVVVFDRSLVESQVHYH